MSEPAFMVDIWPIERLIPYAKNAKKHDPAKVKAIAASMRRDGFTQPIVVEADGTIVAGHGRRMAALEVGFKNVPVFVFRGTKAEADVARLADNQVVSTSYDMGLMADEMRRLDEEFGEMGGLAGLDLGFSTRELDVLLNVPEITMDESAFVEDVHQAVEQQRETNDARAAELDASTAPLADAFGFRRLTVAQSRRVRSFMTQLEAGSGRKGAEALMVFLDNAGVAA